MKLKILKYITFFILVVIAVTGTSHGIVYAVAVGLSPSIGLYYTLIDRIGLQEKITEDAIPHHIKEVAKEYEIPHLLLKSVVSVESNFNPHAISHKGAISLAQIMPANAKRCNLKSHTELWNIVTNLRCGAQILSEELQNYNGDVVTALQVYNGGPKCIKRCTESINYANKVLNQVGHFYVKQGELINES
jgi:soluble lytic murein transglycosylase-like protein